MATHFKGPILYSTSQKGLTNLNTGVWPDQCVKWDDFVDELDTGWVVVKDSGATVAIAADVHNGVLVITSAATTDNDGGSIQANEIFQLLRIMKIVETLNFILIIVEYILLHLYYRLKI